MYKNLGGFQKCKLTLLLGLLPNINKKLSTPQPQHWVYGMNELYKAIIQLNSQGNYRAWW